MASVEYYPRSGIITPVLSEKNLGVIKFQYIELHGQAIFEDNNGCVSLDVFKVCTDTNELIFLATRGKDIYFGYTVFGMQLTSKENIKILLDLDYPTH